jgi:glycosyltransferase involved in cell wall biosynthesis
VDHKNGFIATNREEWKAALKRLITDVQLRASMGAEGRKKIVANYSIQAHKDNFLALFS